MMPVPDYETMMLPVLRAFAEGAGNVAEVLPSLRELYDILPDEAAEMLPSGRVTVLASRAHWARTYLSKAGLLTSPRRNQHVITNAGRELLAKKPEHIDNALLARFEGFDDWRKATPKDTMDGPSNRSQVVTVPSGPDVGTSPEERIEGGFQEIEKALAEDLLGLLQNMDPLAFERLILDLLTAMGYGAGALGSRHMTRATGDGGIDGIIHEDALGLDAVYIQAKRYAEGNRVSRPAIQQFVGSLTGEGATKGVFVTTSDFSREARDFVNRISQRIVLIDGQSLAKLMIRHEVGVRARQTYVLRSIDDDYFTAVS